MVPFTSPQDLALETSTNHVIVEVANEIEQIEGNLALKCAPAGQQPREWFYEVWMYRKLDALDWVTPFEAIKHGAGDLVIHYLTPKVNRLK